MARRGPRKQLDLFPVKSRVQLKTEKPHVMDDDVEEKPVQYTVIDIDVKRGVCVIQPGV